MRSGIYYYDYSDLTTIQLSKKVKNFLRNKRIRKESYDSTIMRLLNHEQ